MIIFDVQFEFYDKNKFERQKWSKRLINQI